ncbi:alanine racemase [Sporosarcina sp. CAU 1771]
MDITKNYRPTIARINLQAVKNNINHFKKKLKSETSIIAVVKAYGYGHGDLEVSKAALEAGADMLAVSTPDEAVQLRLAGIDGDILVMGLSPVSFVEKAVELDISIAVSDLKWMYAVLDEYKKNVKPLKIHVKIDSGMGRIGFRDIHELQLLTSAISGHSSSVLMEGIFTHFSCADEESRFTTDLQYKVFMEFVNSLPEKPRLIHAANTAAASLYPEYGLDAVRIGIGLYGIAPSEFVNEHLPFKLERSMTLESELAFIKLVEKGRKISYGAKYETSTDEWIGTLPIGYADGLRRGLVGQDVLIGEVRAPIVGTICMDQCMIKLPYEMPVGEKVILIGIQGNEEITVEEWANKLDTIPYEIATSISKRVPRVFV